MSGSVLPPALKLHVMAVHEVVKEGTGGSFCGGLPGSVPGLTTTENSWLLPPARLVVAVRPAALPVATAALESASRELTLPLSLSAAKTALVRSVLLAGAVHAVSFEDFSLQELTSQDPAWATLTEGAMKLVVADCWARPCSPRR